jgi:alkylation response protein AidB-like acyl-CoA dehydrogenase
MPADELLDELHDWLIDNWDPNVSVEQWWEKLGLSGWAAPTLPVEAFGRGLSRSDSVRVQQHIGTFGALPAPAGLGMLLAAPTIAMHGTKEQVGSFVRDIVTGKRAWCQLFSEPGAGSDLAGLSSRAIQDGDEWIVNGQKVWTSGGQYADFGMLIARTNPEAPKHQGITYFGIEMLQTGIEIRPLKEMTGHAMFNEVFLTDARVADSAMIGAKNNGWAVANATLGFERAGLSSGGGGAMSTAIPGTIAGHLGMRAGDFVGRSASVGSPTAGPRGAGFKALVHYAKKNGSITDATIRQQLAELHTLSEIGRYNNERVKAARIARREIPGMANIGKLSMSNIVRLQRDLGLRILGPNAMLHGYTEEQRRDLDAVTGDPILGLITGTALYAQAPPIYGGTDQIQKNIIGERVLGLAKEPGTDSKVPFSSLPKNG